MNVSYTDKYTRKPNKKRIACEGKPTTPTAPCLDARCPVIAVTVIAKDAPIGINSERDIEANLQIGPTDQGMVRIFVEANGVEIPMDFTPEEALEIAEEIATAAKVIG